MTHARDEPHAAKRSGRHDNRDATDGPYATMTTATATARGVDAPTCGWNHASRGGEITSIGMPRLLATAPTTAATAISPTPPRIATTSGRRPVSSRPVVDSDVGTVSVIPRRLDE